MVNKTSENSMYRSSVVIGLFVTRYEKRDHSVYFKESLFLVWIVSAISTESNGASFVKIEASLAEL